MPRPHHQPGQTQLSQHDLVRLATQAYEHYDGGTDEGLTAYLLADIVDQQHYIAYRQQSGRGHLAHTQAVEKRIAMEAALIERLRQLS